MIVDEAMDPRRGGSRDHRHLDAAWIFPTLEDMGDGFSRTVEVVRIDHVRLGTDMRGLTGPSVLDNYRDPPLLTAKLLARGFAPVDVGKILEGGQLRPRVCGDSRIGRSRSSAAGFLAFRCALPL